MRQKCRKSKLNLREERKKVKKEEKQPVKPSPPLLHLICSVQLPPLDHSISYTLSETQSGTRISVKQFMRQRCRKPDQICKQFTRRGKQPPPHNSLLSNSPPPLVHQTTGLYGKNTRRTSKTVRTVDRVSLHSLSSDVKKQISRPAAQPDHQPIPHFSNLLPELNGQNTTPILRQNSTKLTGNFNTWQPMLQQFSPGMAPMGNLTRENI